MSDYIDTESIRRAAGSIAGSEENLRRTASTLEDTERSLSRVESSIESCTQQLNQLFNEGYGSNALRLIELLEGMELPGPNPTPNIQPLLTAAEELIAACATGNAIFNDGYWERIFTKAVKAYYEVKE